MVHKKSEYRLNYKWIPSTLCKQAWETGLSYRVQRRLYDLSHLPLPWESTGCDCDQNNDEDAAAHLPLPRVRLKHNVLTEAWDQNVHKFKDDKKLTERPTTTWKSSKVQPCEDWYRSWEEQEHHIPPQIISATKPADSPISKDAKKISPGPSLVDERKMLEEQHSENQRKLKDLHQQEYNKKCSSESMKIAKDFEALEKTEKDEINKIFMASDSGFCRTGSSSNRNIGTQTFERLRSFSPHRKKLDVQATQPTVCQMTKPKILSYGWASQRNVGDKRTFNIYAPTRDVNQFHTSALRAWKRREFDIREALEDERRGKEKYKVSYPQTNRSSIWMTEYQREYNDLKYSRPASAPPGKWKDTEHIYHCCDI